jgi:hypothetical protein
MRQPSEELIENAVGAPDVEGVFTVKSLMVAEFEMRTVPEVIDGASDASSIVVRFCPAPISVTCLLIIKELPPVPQTNLPGGEFNDIPGFGVADSLSYIGLGSISFVSIAVFREGVRKTYREEKYCELEYQVSCRLHVLVTPTC